MPLILKEATMKKQLLKLLLAVVFAGILIVLGVGQMATRATPSEVGKLAPNEQEIPLTASDRVRISASFFPANTPDAPIILLLHGNGASRSQFKSHIGWLNKAGFGAMSIDFRGHGESQAESKSFGLFEARDANAAMLWIRKNHPRSKIGAIGVSLGGAASLLGSQGPLPVDAMILQAVYPDIDRAIRNRMAAKAGNITAAILTPLLTYQSPILYGVWPASISPIKAAQKFKGAVLIIGGGNDVYTPASESTQLSKSFPGQGALWIVDGLSHDQISGLDNPQYQKRILNFFDKALK